MVDKVEEDNSKNSEKDLFILCTHCGEIVDVKAAKETQLEEGRLQKYPWGIGATKREIEHLKVSPPFIKKTWLP